MATLYDAKQKIGEEVQKAIFDLGSGSCVDFNNVNYVALTYNHAAGHIDGLKRALDIIERLEGKAEEL